MKNYRDDYPFFKNNPNTSPNKLIATYNATSNARVNTVSAIAKIVKSFGESDGDNPDPLLNIINGGEDYDADGEESLSIL